MYHSVCIEQLYVYVQIVQTELPLPAPSRSTTLPVPQPLPDLQSRGVSPAAEQDMPDGLLSAAETLVSETTNCVSRGTLDSSHMGSRTVVWRRRPDGSEQRQTQ